MKIRNYRITLGSQENAFVKAKRGEVGAVAGGEMSGHVYFEKNNRADDAVFAFSELLLRAAEEFRAHKNATAVNTTDNGNDRSILSLN